eukprot:10295090-Alexandrium_andersonii.AAC.1
MHLWKAPGGDAPKFEACFKNKHIRKAIGRGRYYCQAPKIGQLVSQTSHPEGDCFCVDQSWVVE